MKGIILNKNNSTYTILSDEGDYVKRKLNKNYDVGEEVNINQTYSFNYKAVAIAASLIILIGILAMNTFIIPFGYAEVSINPSFELAYNRLYKVVASEGLNEDGKKLLEDSKLKLKGLKVEDAYEQLINEAKAKNYIKENEENFVVFAYTKNKSENNQNLENSIIEKSENSGYELMFMNIEKNQYSEMRKNMENPAVEALKNKLREKNINEEEFEEIDQVKELARMIKNTENEQNNNKKPEDTGPPKKDFPQGNNQNKESEKPGNTGPPENIENNKNIDTENDPDNIKEKEDIQETQKGPEDNNPNNSNENNKRYKPSRPSNSNKGKGTSGGKGN